MRREILAEIEKLGRISLIDLADTIGVDLYYIEKQAEQIVSDDPQLTLIQGEIISQSYWDSVAEEINERLQESSQIALAEIAAELQVGSELLASMLDQRLGTLVISVLLSRSAKFRIRRKIFHCGFVNLGKR